MILDRPATLDVPEVFTRPLHAVTPWNSQTDLDEDNRHTFVACRVSSFSQFCTHGRPK